jgi:RND superfamily putative drug exporter
MFSALGRFALRHRYPVLAGWVVLTAVMFIFAPKLSKVGVTDQSQFLPQNSESTIANDLLEKKFAASSREAPSSTVIVVYDEAGLNQQDMDRARALHDWLVSPEAPAAVSRVVSVFDSEALRSTLVSQDNTAMLITVDFSVPALSDAARQAVQAMRDRIATLPGTTFYVTGDAGLLIDLFDSVQNAISRTTLVTIILVIILLLIVYRSPIAVLLPLVAIGFSYVVARGIAGFMADAGVAISTVTDAYLVVTIFGVGTDYCLFIVSRFREELGQGDRASTIDTAMRRIGPVILASAVTVIVAFLCLSVSRFSMTRTSGWALAIGITVTLAAGLTLVPAMMSLFGRYLFWPAIVKQVRRERRFGWERIGGWISSHPVAFAVPIVVLLALPYTAFSNLHLSANVLAQLPQNVESSQGLSVIRERFPVGELSPLSMVIQSRDGSLLTPQSLQGIESVAASMGEVEGISKVDYFAAPSGQLAALGTQVNALGDRMADASNFDISSLSLLQPLSGDLQSLAISYPGVVQSANFTNATATLTQIGTVVARLRSTPPAELPAAIRQLQQSLYTLGDALTSLSDEFLLKGNSAFTDWLKSTYFSTDGTVARMDLVLAGDPYSDAASTTVQLARQKAAAAIASSDLNGDAYYIGGETAVHYDILQTSETDFYRVLIFASIGIMLVIIVLLRSLLAPLYMILTVLFNFGASLGISTWLLRTVYNVNDLIYLLPVFTFIMLAAVGADYNIFLVSRIREEAERSDIKTAVRRAVANTGGVITSCGIILAGTFATLGASPLPVMYEIGIPIAIGVVLDTFLVRALLVPSLATLTGRWSWWPSRLSRKK